MVDIFILSQESEGKYHLCGVILWTLLGEERTTYLRESSPEPVVEESSRKLCIQISTNVLDMIVNKRRTPDSFSPKPTLYQSIGFYHKKGNGFNSVGIHQHHDLHVEVG